MIRKFLLVIAIGMMVLVMIDCKKDDAPEPQPGDVQLAKLIATWNSSSAMRDGIAQDGYDNFKLIIAGTPGADSFTYSCSGRPALSPWPANGTWKFGSDLNTDISRDSNLAARYVVTDTQLTITFDYTGDGFTGRVSEVHGQWVFTFTK